MIYDLHAHIAGVGSGGSGNYLSPAFQRRYAFRLMWRGFKLPIAAINSPDIDQQIAQRTVDWINDSEVDRAVLLAFDAAYHQDGSRDHERTALVTDNDFVADLAERHPKILFGASIHPYRRDASVELARLVGRGACLVKWLPGAQNIQPDHPCCLPFYEAMAHHGIPLLCHTGAEHALKLFPNTLNDPRRLVPALERGVTVIAAHCATRAFLHDRSYFRTWEEMALRYDRFYGDISAFGMVTRIWSLRHMLKSPAVTSKLLFGSDFPIPQMPLSCIGTLNFQKILEIRRTENPFDQAVMMMRAAGAPNDVFTRAEHLLRTPQPRPSDEREVSKARVPKANRLGNLNHLQSQ
jgi:predicted TIM-barrel fold metal-dependent hydrolase